MFRRKPEPSPVAFLYRSTEAQPAAELFHFFRSFDVHTKRQGGVCVAPLLRQHSFQHVPFTMAMPQLYQSNSGNDAFNAHHYITQGNEEEDDANDDTCCYICWDSDSQPGNPLRRDCGCKGTAGWAHIDCLVAMAARQRNTPRTRWEVNLLGRTISCRQCMQPYHEPTRTCLLRELIPGFDGSSENFAQEEEAAFNDELHQEWQRNLRDTNMYEAFFMLLWIAFLICQPNIWNLLVRAATTESTVWRELEHVQLCIPFYLAMAAEDLIHRPRPRTLDQWRKNCMWSTIVGGLALYCFVTVMYDLTLPECVGLWIGIGFLFDVANRRAGIRGFLGRRQTRKASILRTIAAIASTELLRVCHTQFRKSA